MESHSNRPNVASSLPKDGGGHYKNIEQRKISSNSLFLAQCLHPVQATLKLVGWQPKKGWADAVAVKRPCCSELGPASHQTSKKFHLVTTVHNNKFLSFSIDQINMNFCRIIACQLGEYLNQSACRLHSRPNLDAQHTPTGRLYKANSMHAIRCCTLHQKGGVPAYCSVMGS